MSAKKTFEEKRAEQRERHINDHMQQCVHFTGVHRQTCRAGVNYHELLGDGPGCFAHMPCFPMEEPKVECSLCVLPTREEAEVYETEAEERSNRGMKAMRAAHEDAKEKGFGKGHGGGGKLKCPLCPIGDLHYSVASLNGHMHASCSTPGCIAWME